MFDESCRNCEHNSKQIDYFKNWCSPPIKGMAKKIEYTENACAEWQRKKTQEPRQTPPSIIQKSQPTQLTNPRKPTTLSQKTTKEWKTQFQKWVGEK